MSDIYSDPKKFGLMLVAEHQFHEVSYDFDIRAIWMDLSTGLLYTARDSGCSCPSPFENYNSITDLDRASFEELKEEAIREYSTGGASNLSAWLDKLNTIKVSAAYGQIKEALDGMYKARL